MTMDSVAVKSFVEEAEVAVSSYHDHVRAVYREIVGTEAAVFNQVVGDFYQRFPEHADSLSFFAIRKENVLVESMDAYPFVYDTDLLMHFADSRAVDDAMFDLIYESEHTVSVAIDIGLYVEALDQLRMERERKTMILQKRHNSYHSRLQRAGRWNNEPRESVSLAVDILNGIERAKIV
ncbi:hypothetical protein HY312_02440 [Candidatus Saccharibacteria bacterium]|nr:hypothetical protein [Candidatus Saccharibacteria bacterium]